MKKLGIVSISKNTVKRILKEAGMDPSPKRDVDAWDKFVRRHAESLWQCDFLHHKVITWSGLRDAFVIAFIHVKTRRVILSPSTHHPDEAWVVRQSEEFVKTARTRGLRVGVLQHDSDGKFSLGFRQAMKRRQLIPHRNAVAAPVMNAFVEKFLQSIQLECLDHFLIFGTRHLDYLGREYLVHYHEERPHQSLGTRTIRKSPPMPMPEAVPLRDIRCRQRLGGLLKSYRRKAA